MRRKKTAALDIWMNGLYVGSWRIQANGTHQLEYSSTWLSHPARRPVSISLPLDVSGGRHSGAAVESFFDNLLPDNTAIRQRIQRRFSCPSLSAFDLLAEIGRDCVGALQLLPEGSVVQDTSTITAEQMSPSDIAKHLRLLVSGTAGYGLDLEEPFRISIAGAQEKTALLRKDGVWYRPLGMTPTTHILKLPLGRIGISELDMNDSAENEWLCLKILQTFGLPVANAELSQFEEQRVLVVERFDRRFAQDASWIIRVPQEDFCQASAIPSWRKYENEGGLGIEASLRLLQAAENAEKDRQTFLKAQIIFWLLAAPDGHAKNFSIFLAPEGRFSLTPIYDVMSVYPVLGHGRGKLDGKKIRMAMAVSGKNRHYEWAKIHGRHWQETANRSGMKTAAADIIEEIHDRLEPCIAAVESSLPSGFPEYLAQAVFRGLRETVCRL